MEIPGNSTEGAADTTRAQEPHAAINEFDRNLKRRGTLDVHKWLIDRLRTMTPPNQKPFFREPDSPYYNPLDETPVIPSLGKLGPWPPVENIHFKLSMPDLAPPPRARVPVARVLGSVVGAFVALLIIAAVRSGRASRARRGRVTAAGAVQHGSPSISTDQPSVPNYPRQPSGQGEPGSPHNDDLPPAYYECALSSIKKYVSDEPPPYANYKHAEPQVHTRRQSALIEKKLGAKVVTMTTTCNDSGDVAPEMKTELVFDNGRVVERLSLDLDGNNVKTEIASNDNVEQQSSRHAEVKDRVTYIDETDNVKVNTQ